MHIKLINKKLHFKHYRLKCSIGKRGISMVKKEGDGITPGGKFKFKSVFYRKDRIVSINTKIPKKIIRKNMGWCDDPNSRFYNKLIYFPFEGSAEKLYLKKNIYDVILILNYNLNPIIKNKGSAIFLHIATKDYKPTKGCVAISKKDMKIILKEINNKTKIITI
jgi:L,D-peptidoglycan transpeptidase YkuD (ErfK/YbiS/YcfS/YnhG family)